MGPQDWIPARPRRVLLAGYLDWCLLAASFGLLEHMAYVFEPEIGEFPLYMQILAFIGVMIVLFLLLTIPMVRSRRTRRIEQPDTGG